jgi:hypothetical protein
MKAMSAASHRGFKTCGNGSAGGVARNAVFAKARTAHIAQASP